MAWLELHQSIVRHEKTYALARILSQRRPTVIGMLCMLWLWALDNKTPRVNLDPVALADVMGWDGDVDLLAQALLKCGWLDSDENGYLIHHWDDYAGKLLVARESNQRRQAQFRHKLNSNRYVTVTSQLRNHATGPYRTIPDPTVPYKEIYKEKNKYGQFNNVLLSENEYEKLKVKFGASLPERIERLSEGIASKGYKYKSHYAAILTWERKEKTGANGQKPILPGGAPDPDKYSKGKYGHMVQR